MLKIQKYIEEHYHMHISLNDLSGMVGYSPNYISTIFKKECGINIRDYVNLVRIEHAKELLVSTELYAYQIAVSTGFSDESYFSRIFKRATGMSPNKYRNKRTENNRIEKAE